MTTSVCTTLISGVTVPIAAGGAPLTVSGLAAAQSSGWQQPFTGAYGGSNPSTSFGPAATCDPTAYARYAAQNPSAIGTIIFPLN
jgi:hypothetical protein